MTNPSSQPFPLLAPTDCYSSGKVPPSHTLSLLLHLHLCNGFPTLCLLIPVLLFWDLARTIVCSSGIPVPQSLLTRFFSLPFYTPFSVLFLQPFQALSFSVLALLLLLSKFIEYSAFSSPHFVCSHAFHTS